MSKWTIGQLIRQERKKQGLTMAQLGEKMGISGSLVGRYERGEENPKIKTIERFANALGLSLNELISDVNYLSCEDTERWLYFFSAMKVQAIVRDLEQIEQNGTVEDLFAFKKKLEKSMVEIQDAAILSVFHTLSDANKEKAISYCKDLASMQPGHTDTGDIPAQGQGWEEAEKDMPADKLQEASNSSDDKDLAGE